MIDGLAGNDTLLGMGGNDVLRGGPGHDRARRRRRQRLDRRERRRCARHDLVRLRSGRRQRRSRRFVGRRLRGDEPPDLHGHADRRRRAARDRGRAGQLRLRADDRGRVPGRTDRERGRDRDRRGHVRGCRQPLAIRAPSGHDLALTAAGNRSARKRPDRRLRRRARRLARDGARHLVGQLPDPRQPVDGRNRVESPDRGPYRAERRAGQGVGRLRQLANEPEPRPLLPVVPGVSEPTWS